MGKTLKAALIQMNSGPDIAGNLTVAEEMIRQAAGEGAQFVGTPENTCHIRAPFQEKLETSPMEQDHPALPLFSGLAKELGIWLQIGSLSIKLSGDKIANRCYQFDNKGNIVAKYDKIHLFDVDLPNGESHRESNVVCAGDRRVMTETPWGNIGITICYDLRFPYLYRALAQGGAAILTVPSAFTVPTGQAHWEILLRARAIENGCFVLAAAQCGKHHGGRKTYGHSMIVSPWGEILAEGADKPEIIVADLDMGAVSRARQAIPGLQHTRQID